jgi:hypothetical protein
MTTYLYLIQEKEFIDNKLDIYRVGKIILPSLDMSIDFPIDCKLIIQLHCDNDINKKNIYNLFKEKYIQFDKNGCRYFYGDVNSMKIDLFNFVIENDMLKTSKIKGPNNTKRLLLNDILDIKKVKLLTKKYNINVDNELNELFKKDADAKELEDKIIENSDIINELIYKCEYCDIIYKTKNGLWKHKVKYHNNNIKLDPINNNTNNNNNDDTNKCKYCNKKFTRKNNMNVHIKKYCKMKNDIVNILQDKIKTLAIELNNEKNKNYRDL